MKAKLTHDWPRATQTLQAHAKVNKLARELQQKRNRRHVADLTIDEIAEQNGMRFEGTVYDGDLFDLSEPEE